MVTSPPVIAPAKQIGARFNAIAHDAVGFRAGRKAGTPSISIVSVPSPLMRAPIDRRKRAKVHNLGLSRGVPNHTDAVGKNGSHHDVLGTGDSRNIKGNVGTNQLVDRAMDVTALEFELASQCLEPLQVLVDGTYTDGTATR